VVHLSDRPRVAPADGAPADVRIAGSIGALSLGAPGSVPSSKHGQDHHPPASVAVPSANRSPCVKSDGGRTGSARLVRSQPHSPDIA
jgi:hypothetical protein